MDSRQIQLRVVQLLEEVVVDGMILIVILDMVHVIVGVIAHLMLVVNHVVILLGKETFVTLNQKLRTATSMI